jgi:flagellar biosynthetic protein FliS
MSNPSVVSAYQQSAAQGASPIGLLLSLYDTILRDFRRALDAIHRGKIEVRVFELNHALTVIAHLQSVLDFERGAAAAERFNGFYNVTRAMILSVNVDGNPASLQKLIELYTSMRQAWQQAESQLPK